MFLLGVRKFVFLGGQSHLWPLPISAQAHLKIWEGERGDCAEMGMLLIKKLEF